MFLIRCAAASIHWQTLEIDKAQAAKKGQARRAVVHRPVGSGKSTIANLLERSCIRPATHLHPRRRQRPPWLSRDLSFTEADRVENIERVAGWRLMAVPADRAGLVVSPFAPSAASPANHGEGVHRSVRRRRSRMRWARPRALRQGAERCIKNFTGVDSPCGAGKAPKYICRRSANLRGDGRCSRNWLRERENAEQEYDSGAGI